MEESPLSPALLRGLADRSYEKRKASATEVTALVKHLNECDEEDKVVRVISLLYKDFIRCMSSLLFSQLMVLQIKKCQSS